MNFKPLRQTAMLTIIAALVVLSVLSAATFAWFTYTNDVNTTPISGTVSRGEGSLLISTSPTGPFDETCTLAFESSAEALYPLSTADLVSFYTPTAQIDGIVTAYRDATEDVNIRALHGRVFLKAEGSDCEVYFWPASLSFGADAQALAALRLGMRISTVAGTHTYIFRLDEFGNTASAEAMPTVPQTGVVVSGIVDDGTAVYVADPAQLTAPYSAAVTEDGITPGTVSLCTLGADEVGTVEYWLWLEGCDVNCINAVQSRDVALQLGFAGA